MESKGLGDSIEKFTKATGIKTVVEAVSKLAGLEGCGCDERKELLNELFPYKTKYREFEVLQDFNVSADYKKGEIYRVNQEHNLYSHVILLVEQKLLKEI